MNLTFQGFNWRFAQRELNDSAMKSLAPVRIVDVAEEAKQKAEASAKLHAIEEQLRIQHESALKEQVSLGEIIISNIILDAWQTHARTYSRTILGSCCNL